MTFLSYGLNIPKDASLRTTKSAPDRKPIFDEDDDDGDDNELSQDAMDHLQKDKVVDTDILGLNPSEPSYPSPLSQTLNLASKAASSKPSLRQPISTHGDLSSDLSHRRNKLAAEAVDPSIYDYDNAYDAIHASRRAADDAKRQDALERKPKYISGMLAAAERTKRAHQLAEEKRLQRERLAEGDEFKDKEAFVTEAYKAQQAENQRLEEEQEKVAAEEQRKRRANGMQGFYSSLLEEDERRHREAVAAAAVANPAVQKVDDDVVMQKSEAEVAREMISKGVNITMTEEGQVADKRQLLSAGLNVIPKAVPTRTDSAPSRSQPLHKPDPGRSTAQRAQRERQTLMLEQQLHQAAKRKKEEEDAESAKLERASKSQKTEGEIMGARERYLVRKKQQQEEAAAKMTA